MSAAIAAYKEKCLECGDENKQVPRNFVKGLLEGFGIDRRKFYYALKKAAAVNNEDGVSTSENNNNSSNNNNESRDNNGEASSPDDSALPDTGRKTGGRPQGSSKKAQDLREENVDHLRS
jgi:hypothetical protein